jgi:hypothetical protein
VGYQCTDEVSQDSDDQTVANKYQYDSYDLPKYPIAVVPPHVDGALAVGMKNMNRVLQRFQLLMGSKQTTNASST